MKAIISHDIDLLTVWEHKNDLAIPKLIVRSSIELAIGSIYSTEYLLRFKELVENKLHNLEELMEFDKEKKVPSTFFIGVNKGLGLSYSLTDAEYWIKRIMEKGFDVGVHGIEFNDLKAIKTEYESFKQMSGLSAFGIRMHYLRNSKNTLEFLNKAGYIFDSSLYKKERPFKAGNLWEFPLHIMDTYIFNENSRWQNRTLDQAKDKTKAIMEGIHKWGIKYFTILCHDRHFSNSFRSWKAWYIWTVEYLKKNRVELTTYKEAIQELKKKA